MPDIKIVIWDVGWNMLQCHIGFLLKVKCDLLVPIKFGINSLLCSIYLSIIQWPIPVPARSKAWVCGRSLAGITGSNRAGFMDVCLLWVLCGQVEVCVTGQSLVQRSLTECDASECDLEISTMRRSRPTRAVEPCKKHHIECSSLLRAVVGK